ncbi:MAG: hypothetical protein KIG84_05670 [Bacteroidales bacterium]|nr:hypothetical protein [Bacteroidales bacterium]
MNELELKPVDFDNLTIFLKPQAERDRLTERRHSIMEYNKWRKSLPAECWSCDYFNSCNPTYNCPNNKGRH